MANIIACLILATAPKVLVRKRRCAFSRKNSSECFLGCSGYSSGSATPSTTIFFACTSTFCPLPIDSANTPVTDEMRRDRASSIAGILGSAERWHSHGRGIGLKELQSDEIKLKIQDFGANSKLNRLIRDYYGLLMDYCQRLGVQYVIHSRRELRRLG